MPVSTFTFVPHWALSRDGAGMPDIDAARAEARLRSSPFWPRFKIVSADGQQTITMKAFVEVEHGQSSSD